MDTLTFLGTSNAFSHSGENPAAFMINYNQSILLLDCGPSILPSLYKNKVHPDKISEIYISHLHPDHYFGILFLFLDIFYVYELEKPIIIYGPLGTEELIKQNLKNMYSDKECKKLPEIFTFREFNVGETVEMKNGVLEAIPANHGGNARMVIATFLNGLTIGYSGDTSFHEESFNKLLQCHIAIHEATTYKEFIPNHTRIIDLFDRNILVPETCELYLTHHDHSVVEKIQYIREINHKFIIPRDDEVIELNL